MVMKRRACQWCVRVVCSCGWTGYRGKSMKNPRPCPDCGVWPRATVTTQILDVRHRWSTVCHFTPASKRIPY